MRTATIKRNTKETQISLTLNLDGNGTSAISTGVGFFDHMLTLFAAHAMIDLNINAQGDLHIDGHHTVEDVGIALGQAFTQALGDKRGIRRYGYFTLPMDETLTTTAIDFSGRPCFVYKAEFQKPKIGLFDTELVREFWQGFANRSACNLHQILHYGENAHHIAEAIFKATARSVRMAVEIDPRQSGVPSTKGTL
ncbi:MAG: imidazoleglycerol-phosphate dehydratase HisB [Planctomycetaceae bacterium]|jgi:imidazoleglycerol-phosphate dehydratase|nr:imidazoleglycerol-phosphate dehydratase HisB [Planctomycetaceae bacterium]